MNKNPQKPTSYDCHWFRPHLCIHLQICAKLMHACMHARIHRDSTKMCTWLWAHEWTNERTNDKGMKPVSWHLRWTASAYTSIKWFHQESCRQKCDGKTTWQHTHSIVINVYVYFLIGVNGSKCMCACVCEVHSREKAPFHSLYSWARFECNVVCSRSVIV